MTSHIGRLVEKFNQYPQAFSALPVGVPINLLKTRLFSPVRGSRAVLFIFLRPLASSPILSREPHPLPFGVAHPLLSHSLHFGYLFEFPKCELESQDHFIAAIRRRRDAYNNVSLLLSNERLSVFGNSDAILICRRTYFWMPSFNSI